MSPDSGGKRWGVKMVKIGLRGWLGVLLRKRCPRCGGRLKRVVATNESYTEEKMVRFGPGCRASTPEPAAITV